jgi:hypothetical protein
LQGLRFEEVSDAEIKRFLKDLNKSHHVNITQTKISTFLTSKLKQEGIDPVLIELIKGSKPNELAALSYTQLDTKTLLTTFERYARFLAHLSACPAFALTPCDIGAEIIGSPLAIAPGILKQLFLAISDKLTQLNTSNVATFSTHYHNLVTVHAAMILALSSGYRPVTGWLGKITDINLASGQFWISDKENLVGDASRVIVLPAVARDCLKQYLVYLNKADFYFRNTQRELHQRYQDAASGLEHLFFFRSETDWQEVTPKTMAPIFDPIFPLQPNWHRHHIRTMLFQANIHSDLIAAWMGHAEVGEVSFAQYSSLSVSQLNQIADAIEQHLELLEIKAVSYV